MANIGLSRPSSTAVCQESGSSELIVSAVIWQESKQLLGFDASSSQSYIQILGFHSKHLLRTPLQETLALI